MIKGTFCGMAVEIPQRVYDKSKNLQLGRVKSACCGFGRITTYGHLNQKRGPTHFGCGPGFPKRKRNKG